MFQYGIGMVWYGIGIGRQTNVEMKAIMVNETDKPAGKALRKSNM